MVDPRDPAIAFVLPLTSAEDRVTPDGALRVYATRDAGASWTALTQGLPQENAYYTVLRQAFAGDGADPLGLYFGTEQGSVFGSIDAGETWRVAAEHLPPVSSVRCA